MSRMLEKRPYYVYIVANRSGTLYTGMTNDIYRRIMEHKQGEIDGFAKKYKCDRLVYYEGFEYVYSAIAREKEIKGWLRRRKIALVEEENPRWQDLAENWGRQMLLPKQSIRERRGKA